MKKAIVFVKDYQEHTVGQILSIMEASEADAWTHHLISNEFCKKIEMPVELENIDSLLLEGVQVPEAQEYWSKDGEADVYEAPVVDPETWTYNPPIPAHWAIQKNASFKEADKLARIGELYTTLNAAVETEMKQVYDTTNPDSAVANYLTWLSMKTTPSKYVDKGLVARFEIVGLTIGDALDTETKVTDYSTALLNLADDYAIWREQQILVYAGMKLAIEAE